MTPNENKEMLNLLDNSQTNYKSWNELGTATQYTEGLNTHLNAVLSMKHIDVESIKKRRFKVLLDCVNGAGSYVMPQLLEKLGCEVIAINCEKSGIFPRLPEPIPQNLVETMKAVKENKVDVGIIVDPDVDRLVLLTEKGEPFSEENTIAQAVRFVLSKTKGSVVVNLSTTRAVDDIAEANGCKTYHSSVGEANVVKLMKEVDAVIGGEGSGGVIYPELHYGRDALVGTVILLQQLLEFGGTMSELKAVIPQYSIAKKKIEIGSANPDEIVKKLIDKYSDAKINTDDGLRIDFDDHWIHLRKSNTEPIIRCIAESDTMEKAEKYANKYFSEIIEMV